MSNKISQRKLIHTLREYCIEDILLLYIEARTGYREHFLPPASLNHVNELEDMVSHLYADRVIDSVFKRN